MSPGWANVFLKRDGTPVTFCGRKSTVAQCRMISCDVLLMLTVPAAPKTGNTKV
jgi:hypothetical protein